VSTREVTFRDARGDRPRWARLLNATLAPTAGWLRLSPEAFARKVRRASEDAGLDGLAFEEEYAALLASIESEARLHSIGRLAARDDTLRLIRTQIRTRRALLDDPVEAVETLPPLIILGWPRTGSSYLLGLLARDPANRALPYYESFDPVPPAGPDRRAQKVDSMLRLVDRLAPGYQAIHPMKGSEPEECVAIFMLAFRTLQFDIQYRVPGYRRFLRGSDPLPAYRFHRDVLRLLQRARPQGRRWLLKDPTHLFAFETLHALHPRARFIHLHRDPVEAIGSICSLYAHTRAMFSDQVDPEALGEEILRGDWATGLEALLEARRVHPEIPVADLRYGELRRDPIAAIEGVYASLGLPFSDEARRAIQQYARANPQHARGRHRYSLERFGLREDEVRERFADYTARFGPDLR